MLLVARIRVAAVLPVAEFPRRHLAVSEGDLTISLFDLEQKLARERPELGHAAPFGCVDEAAVIAESTPARLDVEIPTEALERLSLRTKQGAARALPLTNGTFTRATTLQGHFFRLVLASIAVLHPVIDDTQL